MATCPREPQAKPYCMTNVGGPTYTGKPHVKLAYGGLYGEKLKREEERKSKEADPEVICTNMCGPPLKDALYIMQHYVRKLDGYSAIAHEVKRQFERSYGGIWQGIVGQSFGTDYAHTGPYLHARIYKTNLIVWRTVSERKLARDRKVPKPVKLDKRVPEARKPGHKPRGPVLIGGRYTIPPRQRVPISPERADRKYIPAGGYDYAEDFLDIEDYRDFRPRDYPEDDYYDSRGYPARSYYTRSGYPEYSYHQHRGYPEDSYYQHDSYNDPYPYDEEDNGLYDWQAYDRERQFPENDDQGRRGNRDDYQMRRQYDRADLDQPMRGNSQRYHPGAQYRDQVTDSVMDFGAGPGGLQYYRGY